MTTSMEFKSKGSQRLRERLEQGLRIFWRTGQLPFLRVLLLRERPTAWQGRLGPQ